MRQTHTGHPPTSRKAAELYELLDLDLLDAALGLIGLVGESDFDFDDSDSDFTDA